MAHGNVLRLLVNLETSPPVDSVATRDKNTKAESENHSRKSAIILSLMLVMISSFICSSPRSDGADAHASD